MSPSPRATRLFALLLSLSCSFAARAEGTREGGTRRGGRKPAAALPDSEANKAARKIRKYCDALHANDYRVETKRSNDCSGDGKPRFNSNIEMSVAFQGEQPVLIRNNEDDADDYNQQELFCFDAGKLVYVFRSTYLGGSYDETRSYYRDGTRFYAIAARDVPGERRRERTVDEAPASDAEEQKRLATLMARLKRPGVCLANESD